ncbi:MAG: 2-iminoacetate synthase ThiH, partial [Candidatus Cloacimonetes bacterium]|nr:2-iminoacetate synthase ThiH [Candidatus Cloacimonadota bacterium]
NDIDYVQFMLAYRLFLPRVGITISTREKAEFRDKLIHLGATKFSAGSSTEVGGYSQGTDTSIPQFEISDNRDVAETVKSIKENGYQPIFKDWEML